MYYASLSAIFKPLHSKMNQELDKKHHWNQSSHCDGATPVNYHLRSEASIIVYLHLLSTLCASVASVSAAEKI